MRGSDVSLSEIGLVSLLSPIDRYHCSCYGRLGFFLYAIVAAAIMIVIAAPAPM